LREELRDGFGPVPDEVDRLLARAELRALGARVARRRSWSGATRRAHVSGSASPRLARLTAALDDVQFAAEVRRPMPLALRLTRLGGLATGPGLLYALRAVAGDNDHAEAGAPAVQR
jgi:hypothetical protein